MTVVWKHIWTCLQVISYAIWQTWICEAGQGTTTNRVTVAYSPASRVILETRFCQSESICGLPKLLNILPYLIYKSTLKGSHARPGPIPRFPRATTGHGIRDHHFVSEAGVCHHSDEWARKLRIAYGIRTGILCRMCIWADRQHKTQVVKAPSMDG
eukprot:6200778-Pleurochrysis_carterae.AAC.2